MIEEAAARGPVRGEVVAPLDLLGQRDELDRAEREDHRRQGHENREADPRLPKHPETVGVHGHGRTVSMQAPRLSQVAQPMIRGCRPRRPVY